MDNFFPDNFFLLLTAISVALPASLLGVYLVLKKMVMIGDAISHAVLPGIVIAYILTDSRDSIPMLTGAALMGILTTQFIDFLSSRFRIQQDAAIGTGFTFLFAVGVLLIAFFAGNNTDIDQECVLYGDLEMTFLDQKIFGGYIFGTGALFQMLPVNLLVILVIVLAYRPLAIWAFNPDYGKIRGLRMSRWQFVIMLLVALHAVFSFESVGAIMVVGMLVLPAATALLLSDKLKNVLFISGALGIIACIPGFFISVRANVSIAPTVVAFSGLLFVLVWLGKNLVLKFTDKKPIRGLQ